MLSSASASRSRFWICFTPLVCLLVLTSSCHRQPQVRVVHGQREEHIGIEITDYEQVAAMNYEEGCHIAWVVPTRMARLAKKLFGRAAGYYVVYDGKSQPAYDQIRLVGFPWGSPLMYVATHRDKQQLVVAGKPLEKYDEIGPLDVTWGGEHLCYAARRGKTWYLIRDGKRLPTVFSSIQDICLSRNGKHLCYAARQGGRLLLVTDNRTMQTHASRVRLLHLDNTGKRLLYFVWAGGAQYFGVNEVKEGPYDRIRLPQMRKDGKVYAYIAERAGRQFVVWNGRKLSNWDEISDMLLSPDGDRLAWVARLGSKWFMVVDGNPGPPCESVGAPHFSIDGKSLCYIAQINGVKFAVFNNKPDPASKNVEGLVLNSENVCVGYVIPERGKRVVVVGSRRSKGYDAIRQVTQHGNHLIAVVQQSGKWFLSLDGREGAPYDRVLTWAIVREDGMVECLAARNGRLYRVTAPLK